MRFYMNVGLGQSSSRISQFGISLDIADWWQSCAFDDKSTQVGIMLGYTLKTFFGYRGITD